MNNPNSNYTAPHASPPSDSNYPPRPHTEGHDEHTPRSESEEGHTSQDPSRGEGDNDEDANNSLTAQALNPDGTPKRPMNAFMIFARRRRPQVSAQNQSMRTGEISKILSKEWATMPPAEKQFYLDQAKQLKETFNSKYPDYVYRRRPNNSRKGRKHKPLPGRGMENPLPPEMSDDMSAVGDLGEAPLTDGEEHQGSFTPPELQYSRVGDVPSAAPRPPGYQYPGIRSSPLSYPPAGPERLPHESHSSSARTLPPGSTSMGYSYLPSSNHHSSVYGEPGTSQSHGQWERSEHSRSTGWSGHDAQMSSLNHRSNSYSPSPGTQWPGSTTPPIPPPSAGPSSSTYNFPTLTSPFYPNHPQQPQNSYPTPSSAASSNSSPTQFSTQSTQMHPPTPLREYEDRFASSPSLSPNYPAGSRDPLLYSQRQSMPRSLPPVQAMANYPSSHLPHPSSHTAHPPHSAQAAMRPGAGQGYWSPEKNDNL